MKNDVGVQVEWSLQRGCEQRVIDNQKYARLVRDLCCEFNVREFQRRVSG